MVWPSEPLGRGRCRRVILKPVLYGTAALSLLAFPVNAAEPIKIGFSSPDTGGSAASGRQFVLTAEIWAEKINNMNGLLGSSRQIAGQ